MYQDHFGLHADPFALSPSLKFLYRSQAHAETMAHLGYGLEQGEDIIMISGSIGTGKTLALQNLLAKVSNLFDQVLVNVTAVGYVEFLKLVLDEMGETWPDGADAADLLVRMKRRAMGVHQEGRKILLVVDEAQNLNPETLEGVRLLTNLGQPDKQLFQIVLAGQPGLVELVDRPELAQLRQRIRVHYALEPLTARETSEYIHHRTSVAGAMAPLFSAAAVTRIHELSGGIPRLVNHLAGHAMLSAYVDKDRRVESHHVAAEGTPEAPAPAAEPAPEPETARPPRVEQAEDPRRQPRVAPGPRPAAPPRERSWRWAWVAIFVAAVVGVWWVMSRIDAGAAPERPTLPPAVTRIDPEPAQPAETEAAVDRSVTDETPAAEQRPAVNPITEVEERPLIPATARHWIHVASFRDEPRVRVYRERLAETGVETELRDVTLDDGLIWHRVLVGPYASSEEATEVAGQLEDRGLISFHRLLED